MALLRIEAATLSFEKSATNAKADRIVTACALAWGYTGDAGDKAAVLAFFGAALIRRLQEIAAAEENRSATATALATNAGNLPAWE